MVDIDRKSKILAAGKWFLNIFLYQCVGVIVIYSCWVPIVSGYSVPFSWHVIISTLGILPFMSDALLLFTNDSWSYAFTRKEKYWIHGILISIGTLLFTVGILLETHRKSGRTDTPHFESIHAITGLVSMILIILAFVCGFAAFNSSKLKNYAPPVWFKFIHNVLGQFGYIIGLVSLIYGFHTSWFAFYTTPESRYAATVVTAIITIWSIKGAIKSAFQQIKSILG